MYIHRTETHFNGSCTTSIKLLLVVDQGLRVLQTVHVGPGQGDVDGGELEWVYSLSLGKTKLKEERGVEREEEREGREGERKEGDEG